MARPIRIEFENAAYHVMARGNERREIFHDDRDRTRFLKTFEECVTAHGLVVHAYCLMPNHYHLLIQTPRANLSAAIGWLQTTYSVRFNRRHGRSGHLFQGRFKAVLVDMGLYGGSLIKYIHLNPVRPRNKRKPIAAERARELDRYRWSSHRQFAGIERHACHEWLSLESLRCFGQTKQLARSEYRSQLAEMFGRPVHSPWDQLRGGLVLGGEALWDRVRDLVASSGQDEEVRWVKRLAAQELSTAVDELVSEESDRRIQIWILVRLGGRRMMEVARDYNYRDGSGVHQVVRRLESRAACDPALARELETLRRRASGVKS